MAQIKGMAVKATLKYVVAKYQEIGKHKIFEELSEDDKKVLSTEILPSSWYSFDTFGRLCRAIYKAFGRENSEVLQDTGAFSASDGLSTIYKMFYKIGSPQFIISRAATLWQRYYDTGSMEVVSSDKNNAHLRIVDFKHPYKEFCMRLHGWFRKCLEMSGGRNVVVVEEKCCCKGDEYCEFHARWE